MLLTHMEWGGSHGGNSSSWELFFKTVSVPGVDDLPLKSGELPVLVDCRVAVVVRGRTVYSDCLGEGDG